jgi:hypothetical protein
VQLVKSAAELSIKHALLEAAPLIVVIAVSLCAGIQIDLVHINADVPGRRSASCEGS